MVRGNDSTSIERVGCWFRKLRNGKNVEGAGFSATMAMTRTVFAVDGRPSSSSTLKLPPLNFLNQLLTPISDENLISTFFKIVLSITRLKWIFRHKLLKKGFHEIRVNTLFDRWKVIFTLNQVNNVLVLFHKKLWHPSWNGYDSRKC